MRRRRFRILMFLLLLAGLLGSMSAVRAEEPGLVYVDLGVHDVNVTQAIQAVQDQLTAPIVVEVQGTGFHKVNVVLRHVLVGQAMEAIALSARADLTYGTNDAYILKPATPISLKLAPPPQADAALPALPPDVPLDATTILPAATADSGPAWMRFNLRHTTPGEIMARTHWSGQNNTPAGVRQIYGSLSLNALFAQATPEGYVNLQKIIAGLDMDPRWIALQVQYVHAPGALGDQAGKSPVQTGTALAAAGLLRSATPLAVLSAAPALFALTDLGDQTLTAETVTNLRVRARVNTDETLSVALEPSAFTKSSENSLNVPFSALPHLQTVHSGETLVFRSPAQGKPDLLVFVTPYLMPVSFTNRPAGMSSE